MSPVNNDVPINVSSINDITLDQVLGDSKSHAAEGRFRLGGQTYTVKIVGSQVAVNLSSRSLWSLFKPDRSVDINAKLNNDMQARLSAQAAMVKEKYAARRDELAVIRQTAQIGDDVVIATYGFKDTRANMQNALKQSHQSAHITTIDALNTALGIMPDDLQGNKIYETLHKIENGGLQFTKIAAGRPHAGEEDSKLCEKWADFLKRDSNLKRLDIFEKIYNFIHETESGRTPSSSWGKLAKDLGEPKEAAIAFVAIAFVKKNLPRTIITQFELTPEQLTKLIEDVADYLLEYAKLAHTLPVKPNAAAFAVWANSKYEHSPASENEDNKKYQAIKTMSAIITTAAFRQTSKMGLEFFAEQKIPVAFAWKTHTGESLSETPTPSGRRHQEKWWRSRTDGGEAPLGRFEPITNSEMRHVERRNFSQPDDESSRLSVVLIPGDRVAG